MQLKIIVGSVVFVALCATLFVTPQAGVGTILVAVTALQLAYLVLVGARKNTVGMFWGGLLGLGWLTVCVGSTWEVQEDVRKVLMGGSSTPVMRTYSLEMATIYRPLMRSSPADGSIVEFRSMLDGSFKNYADRPIPSSANFARLVTSLSAWAVAGLTVVFVRWRLRGTQREDATFTRSGSIAETANSERGPVHPSSPQTHKPGKGSPQ